MAKEGVWFHDENLTGVGTGSGFQVHNGPLFHQVLQAQSWNLTSPRAEASRGHRGALSPTQNPELLCCENTVPTLWEASHGRVVTGVAHCFAWSTVLKWSYLLGFYLFWLITSRLLPIWRLALFKCVGLFSYTTITTLHLWNLVVPLIGFWWCIAVNFTGFLFPNTGEKHKQ